MFLITLFLLTVIFKSVAFQFPDIKTEQYYLPTLSIRATHSIVYTEDKVDDLLINSIITNLFKVNTVVLIKGSKNANSVLTEYKMRRVTNDPNIYIVTKALEFEEMDTDSISSLMISYWSTINIVLTNTEISCTERGIDENTFQKIKNLTNTMWHNFLITRILVSFPYTCPDVYVIFDGKEWTNNQLYDRTIKVIKTNNIDELRTAVIKSGDPKVLTEGFPLKVSIFERFATSIHDCDVVNQYTKFQYGNKLMCGIDGMVMADYVMYYKFNFYITQEKGCDRYGFVNPKTNTTTGSLDCILRHVIDISFNSRFLVKYTNQEFYFLNYIWKDSLCIVLKTPERIPLWQFTYNTFPPVVWFMLLISFSLLGLITWLKTKVATGTTLAMYKYVVNAVVSSMLGFTLYKDHRFLILKSVSFMSCIIILAQYQGTINYQFNTIVFHKRLNTLEEVYHSHSHHLYMSPSIGELLHSSTDLNAMRLKDLMHIFHTKLNISTDLLLSHPNIGIITRKNDVLLEWHAAHRNEDGMPDIYVLNKCLRTYFLSYIARRDFLFIEETIKFIMRLLEAGLPKTYNKWTRRTFYPNDKTENYFSRPRPLQAINIGTLRTAFILLAVGYMVTILTFILERIIGRKNLNQQKDLMRLSKNLNQQRDLIISKEDSTNNILTYIE